MNSMKQEISAANKRASARRARVPTVTRACYDLRQGVVVIDLSNGTFFGFRPQDAEGLEHAKPEQLKQVEISPSGMGLHFPALDADIYVPALLRGFFGSRRWMAAQLGKAGGSATSAAKSAAARKNGKLGGRGKKAADRVEPLVAEVAEVSQRRPTMGERPARGQANLYWAVSRRP
jgi:hypothetical protein